jgi:hypothetical protein
MADVQRYVSSELSHFVGKGKSEEDQYRLLLEILRTGLLMHKPFKHPQQRMSHSSERSKIMWSASAIFQLLILPYTLASTVSLA